MIQSNLSVGDHVCRMEGRRNRGRYCVPSLTFYLFFLLTALRLPQQQFHTNETENTLKNCFSSNSRSKDVALLHRLVHHTGLFSLFIHSFSTIAQWSGNSSNRVNKEFQEIPDIPAFPYGGYKRFQVRPDI